MLLESLVEDDFFFMEKFFNNPNSLSSDEIIYLIRKKTIKMKFVPVICGSSFKNKGVQCLLDSICRFLPSPIDIDNVTGINPENNLKEIRKINEKEYFSSLSFKILTDQFVGKLSFIRVYSGKLKSGSYILNTRTGNKERISRIYQMHANKQIPINEIKAGDIGAIVGFKNVKTGDTLCDIKKPIVLENISFPDPVIGVSIEPKYKSDFDKMSMSLSKLSEEDPTFKVKINKITGETIISGMGELHLEIIIDRIKREFNIELNKGIPQVEYKEMLTKSVEHREIYKKQTGGRGKFADILFNIGPSKKNKGLEFISKVRRGNIPKEYIPSIEKGFLESMKNGAIYGYEIESMKVILKDGSYHPVDSDQLSFEIAARIGFKESSKKAKPVILEPIMKIEVITPEENMGDIVGDLNRRRAIIQDILNKKGIKIIKATVPLSEMFGYVTSLRTLSSGRAISTMEFSHYMKIPEHIYEKIKNI